MATTSISLHCPVAEEQVIVWHTKHVISGIGNQLAQVQHELDCNNEDICSSRELLFRCPVRKWEKARS